MAETRDIVLVETCKVRSFAARILDNRWHPYNPLSVVHRFSPKSLGWLFRRGGFLLMRTGRPSKRVLLAQAIALLEPKFPYLGNLRAGQLVARLLPNAHLTYTSFDVFWAA